MPQDGLRSAVYRSFVKCDDPKGVAECKTMRKSKTNTNNLNPSLPQNSGKGNNIHFKTILKEESVRPSSSHLVEVSKGAQKLNQVIDTYSNGMRFDHHSKEIAKDLLKGALDLQESLMVLGKLQEASNYMSKFRKKPKGRTKDDKSEEKTGIERSKSDRYTDYNYQTGFQKPRFSVDGSSRDCYDELRTVIRDSFARQNLLPPNFQEKTNSFEGKMLDSMVDIPSTSSTQSSTMNFISFTSSDASFSSDSTKKSKGSNLIAKLMGLEEIPSQQGFISSPKRFEIETISGPRRPTFEINMANAKKSQLGVYKEDLEEKKLRNIVDTMRCKGLLKINSNEGPRAQLNYSDSSYNRKKVLIEDVPPIVIMKPMDVSRAESEENDLQKLARKSGMNRGPVDFDEVCRKLRGDDTPVRKGFREFKEKEFSKKIKASGFVDQKEKKKRLERIEKAKEPKKKLGEMENLKSKTASLSHDQAKVSSMKEKKSETEPISRRKSVSLQKSNSTVIVSKIKSPLSRNNSDRKKIQYLETGASADPLVDKDVEHKHGEGECAKVSTSSTFSAQHFTKEEIDVRVDQIKDQLENAKLETIVESDEEACYLNNHNVVKENKCFENQTREKKLLLSSSSFLNNAIELFDIETNSQTIQGANDPELADSRLLLDVANELMLQKITQAARPPFLAPPKGLKISLPLTQLVNEVCKGIEEFSKYSENGNERPITETVFSILERDMLGSGAWELGWRHGYFFDEVEAVVSAIENKVFDELIEGMFQDLQKSRFSICA